MARILTSADFFGALCQPRRDGRPTCLAGGKWRLLRPLRRRRGRLWLCRAGQERAGPWAGRPRSPGRGPSARAVKPVSPRLRFRLPSARGARVPLARPGLPPRPSRRGRPRPRSPPGPLSPRVRVRLRTWRLEVRGPRGSAGDPRLCPPSRGPWPSAREGSSQGSCVRKCHCHPCFWQPCSPVWRPSRERPLTHPKRLSPVFAVTASHQRATRPRPQPHAILLGVGPCALLCSWGSPPASPWSPPSVSPSPRGPSLVSQACGQWRFPGRAWLLP